MDQITPEMWDGPAGMPPPGTPYLSPNPQNTGPVLVVVSLILGTLMLCFLGNRVYVKVKIAREWTWDDVTCGIASVMTLVYIALCIFGVFQCHIGKHQYDITLRQLLDTKTQISLWLTEVLVNPTYLILKLTFFIFFLKLFKPLRWLRIAIWIGIVINVLLYLGWSIANFIIGTPRRDQTWQEHFMGMVDSNATTIAIPAPVTSLIVDLYIFVIPLAGIKSLKLNRKRKIGVALIFMTGILAIIASTLRIVYTMPLLAEGGVSDITFNLEPVYTTAIVEMTLGVIVTCMPSFAHTMRHSELVGRMSTAFRSRGSKQGGTYQYGTKEKSAPAGVKHSKPKPSGYIKTPGESDLEAGWELNSYNPVQTYISAERPSHHVGQVDDDSSYKRVDVQQMYEHRARDRGFR